MRRTAVLGAAVLSTGLAVACAATTATSKDVKAHAPLVGCGGPRARVKTLTDALAGKVSTTPKETTVAALRRLRVPRGLTRRSPRQQGAERTTYKVQARMVETALEKDGDIRLVILDPKTKGKLAAEFPAPGCTRDASAENRTRMRSARRALIAACGMPARTGSEVGGNAAITGVGFFERGDGADRESRNGFELHPVLGFEGKCLLGAG